MLTGAKQIEYRASAVVTAMIRGGAAVLDEGNRMPERSWASLAPLMDDRQVHRKRSSSSENPGAFYLSIVGHNECWRERIELPGYIQSRLKPKIERLRLLSRRGRCNDANRLLLRGLCRNWEENREAVNRMRAARWRVVAGVSPRRSVVRSIRSALRTRRSSMAPDVGVGRTREIGPLIDWNLAGGGSHSLLRGFINVASGVSVERL